MGIPSTFAAGEMLWLRRRGLVVGAVLGAILVGARAAVAPLRSGLDPSFVFAYNHAAATGKIWGREFVSTYGPLGYLINALDIGDHAWRYLAFHLLLAGALGLLAALWLERFPGIGRLPRVVALILLIYSFAFQVYEWPMFALLVLLLLVALHGGAERRYFGLAGALSGLFLLVKFTLGFGALATVGCACLAAGGARRIASRAAWSIVPASLVVLLGWIALIGHPEALLDYLRTGWQISSGYSAAMGLQPPGGWVSGVCFVSFFVLLALWGRRLAGHGSARTAAVLAFPLFTAWKHAMVRQDGHVAFLTLFGLFVVAIMTVHALQAARGRESALFGALAVVLLVLGSTGNRLVAPGTLLSMVGSPLRRCLDGDAWRLARLGPWREALRRASSENLASRLLDPALRRRIGAEPVDVYPWEAAYVPANGLNWVNRPIPTSFSVYTPALDRMNAAFLESAARAPRFILWHHDVGVRSIDGRYLLHDEPLTLWTLLRHYGVEGSSDAVTLLRRLEQPRFRRPTALAVTRAAWGAWVDVPSRDHGLLLSARHARGLVLRLRQFLFRQDPIYLSLRLSDGSQQTYRVVPDNLESGLWLAPFPATLEQLQALLRFGGAPFVVALRFDADPLTRRAGELTLQWQRLELEPAAETEATTWPGTTASDPCAGAIETAAPALVDWGRSPGTLVSGWVHAGSPALELWLSAPGGQPLPARVLLGRRREDVAEHYDDPRLLHSGWIAAAAAPALPAEVGFVARLADGRRVPSCNRLAAP